MPTYYEVRPGSDPVRVSEEYVPAEVRADEPEPTELVPPGNDGAADGQPRAAP
jgi:hypothetical protein